VEEEQEAEKKRIKEEQRENKNQYEALRQKIVRAKHDNAIPFFRYKALKTCPTFHPEVPPMPVIQVKAKNVAQELMDDLVKEAEVKQVESRGKKKVMRRLQRERQRKEQNEDLLNQTFQSVDMNERKDQEAIKFRDSSSEDEILEDI